MNKKIKWAGAVNLLSGIVGFFNIETYLMYPILIAAILAEVVPNLAFVLALLALLMMYVAFIVYGAHNGVSLVLGFGLLTKPTMKKSLQQEAKGLAISNALMIVLWMIAFLGITFTIGWKEDIFNMVYTDKIPSYMWNYALLFTDLFLKGVSLILNAKLLRKAKQN